MELVIEPMHVNIILLQDEALRINIFCPYCTGRLSCPRLTVNMNQMRWKRELINGRILRGTSSKLTVTRKKKAK